MACRRETRHFVTASLRALWASRLAGRSRTSVLVGVLPVPGPSWGLKR